MKNVRSSHASSLALGCAFLLVVGCSSDGGERTFETPSPQGFAPPPTGEGSIPLDPTKDNDLDGFTFAEDCNDRDPNINPGAFDVPADGIDNDCSGTIDDGTVCDESEYQPSELGTTDARNFARALGLCRDATADDPKRRWGVVEAALTRVDGSPIDRPKQHGILDKYGAYLRPLEGKRFAALSTYFARDPADYSTWEEWTRHKTVIPQGFYAPDAACGSTPPSAIDSIKLRLKVRVPTNARGFRFAFDYFTASFPASRCGLVDTAFVALLESRQEVDSARHGNIAADPKGSVISPATASLRSCEPYDGASMPYGVTYDCPLGPRDLLGTGYESPTTRALYTLTAELGGASTSWYDARAGASAGEIITIDFALWGTNELVLLDDWRWLTEPTVPVTSPR